MLILARKEDGAIWLFTTEGVIIVKVLEIETKRVRIGIDAPLSVKVLREELLSDGQRSQG